MPIAGGHPGRRVQYAALPYRVRRDGEVQIRLITSRETRRWVIPKGWPMKGLSPPKAAARECYEEAGLMGTVSREPIGMYTYEKRLGTRSVLCDVLVFPLKVKRLLQKWPERFQRYGFWFSIDSAAGAVHEEELAELIRAFGEMMARKQEAKRRAAEEKALKDGSAKKEPGKEKSDTTTGPAGGIPVEASGTGEAKPAKTKPAKTKPAKIKAAKTKAAAGAKTQKAAKGDAPKEAALPRPEKGKAAKVSPASSNPPKGSREADPAPKGSAASQAKGGRKAKAESATAAEVPGAIEEMHAQPAVKVVSTAKAPAHTAPVVRKTDRAGGAKPKPAAKPSARPVAKSPAKSPATGVARAAAAAKVAPPAKGATASAAKAAAKTDAKRTNGKAAPSAQKTRKVAAKPGAARPKHKPPKAPGPGGRKPPLA